MKRINKIIQNQFILMALLVVGFSTSIVAQDEQTAFKIPPEFSQGFIVLNDVENVDYWEVVIENVTLMNASDPNARTSITLSGLNYFKMPDNFDHLNHSMIIDVKGFSGSNEMLITDNSSISNNDAIEHECLGCGSDVEEQCRWVCNGNGYAYEIVSYAPDVISSPFLRLEATNNNGVPFYQYMTWTQFQFFCQAGPQSIGCIPDNGVTNIVIPASPNNNYVDLTNSPITGTVYGIAKDLGLWGNSGTTIETNVLAGMPGTGCGQIMQWAINKINTASGPNGGPNRITENGKPQLECIVDFNDNNSSGSSFDMDCFNNISFQLGPDGDVFDYLNLVAGCNGSSYEKWWDDIDQVTFSNLADSEADPISVLSTDLFNQDGVFNSPNITMNEGLYTIGLIFSEDRNYLPIIKEVKQTFNSSIDLSSFFTANIFANPIIEDNFNLEMSVDATLDFRFVLTDITGVKLLSKDFVIKKDETHTENIRLDEDTALPPGTLIASFIFKDGSTKSYNIIKN
jgi:hypothetical protein